MPELTDELLLVEELRDTPDDELRDADEPLDTDVPLDTEVPWDTDPLLRDAVPALETELPVELRVTFLAEVAGTRLTVDDDVPRDTFAGRAADALRYDPLLDAPPRAENPPSRWPPRAMVLELDGVKRIPPPGP